MSNEKQTETATSAGRCPYCGMGAHIGRCPQVKSYEYHPDGALKRVEFYSPNDYPPIKVIGQAASSSAPLVWQNVRNGHD